MQVELHDVRVGGGLRTLEVLQWLHANGSRGTGGHENRHEDCFDFAYENGAPYRFCNHYPEISDSTMDESTTEDKD